MAKFPIRPYLEPDPLVPSRYRQAMLQTNIDAVIGLSDKLQEIDNVLFQLTGKHYTGNKVPEFITKADLSEYATKNDVKDNLTGAKKYTDDSLVDLATTILSKANQYTDASITTLKNNYDAQFKGINTQIGVRQTLSSGDLNNVTDHGIYLIPWNTTSNITNGPWSKPDAGVLLVDSAQGDNYVQVFISTINAGAILIRTHSGYPSNWSKWIILSA